MAADGQVVFTVEMDDSAFQRGLETLRATLGNIGQAAWAALGITAAQLAQAYASGGQWADRMAAGIKASKSVAAAAKSAAGSAAQAARAAARTGGIAVGQSLVDGMAQGASGRSGALSAALARIVREALAAAKNAAGIASPSKLFRDEVGRYLALGVQTGFEDAMAASVLPAVSKNVVRSALAGQAALRGTLLGTVEGLPTTDAALPTLAQAGAAAAQGAAFEAARGTAAQSAGDSVVNVTQTITFQAPMQAPDEVARAIRRQATWGLAGARS